MLKRKRVYNFFAQDNRFKSKRNTIVRYGLKAATNVLPRLSNAISDEIKKCNS